MGYHDSNGIFRKLGDDSQLTLAQLKAQSPATMVQT